MKPQYGFTPKDVFVTILCIFILCTCLSAVSISGRRHAKSIVCQAHLAQWGRIFQDLVAENDGKFLPGTYASGFGWSEVLPDVVGGWKENKIWFCPEAEVPCVDEQKQVNSANGIFNAWGIWDLSFPPPGKTLAGSYGLNNYLLVSVGATYASGVRRRDGWKSLEEQGGDQIPVLLDSIREGLLPEEIDAPFNQEYRPGPNSHMGCAAINRHMGAVNSLFLDSSVRRVDLKALWTLKWHRSFNTAGPWTLAGGIQPEDWPEWIRDFQAY